MNRIAVIGAGTMGNGIAHVFAQKGYNVNLVDISQEAIDRGIVTISNNLDRMVAKEKISESDKTNTLNGISTYTELAEGIKNANLIIEAATENIDLKLKIFKELDMHCDDEAILATNTSSISITRIASSTRRPEKVIGMHFMNPVPIMPLVEIIRGYSTSEETTDQIIKVAKKLDKAPTVVNDYPGFVANRILMPMINEAIETLHHGVAGVTEIDTVMKLGMAHPMGPLQLADFIGLDTCLSILNVLYEGFKHSKYAPCPLLINMVTAGKLGVKSGEGFYDYSLSQKAEKIADQFAV
ncbi:3-hydroxybutyryl-CoA dehydrogenase [uncultured Kriegella sp.]|uniref:3-hydroxyacyl-CoA dehydrogenase family protein n=1 Tax=uncultured Kriegella sp. TaxID=1798910 RepID=UPI0030D8228D|tara:strand:+ start:351561 stop:352451 length:891 start_codon:yes stop_codon:yes gene_type:complete